MQFRTRRNNQRSREMVGVRVSGNGDVVYACMRCNVVYTVDYDSRNSPFWDVLNGNAVLLLLGHFMTVHGSEMIFPVISESAEIGGTEGEVNGNA